MEFKLLFHNKAKVELLESAEWYAEKSIQIFSEFSDKIASGIENIKINPHAYPVVYKNKRKCIIKRFPFSIIFIIQEDKIYVISVFHHSRNPNIWKKR